MVKQKYAELCQQLGDVEYKIAQLIEQRKVLREAIKALNIHSKDLLTLEALLAKKTDKPDNNV